MNRVRQVFHKMRFTFVSNKWTIEDAALAVKASLLSLSESATRVKDDCTGDVAALHAGPVHFLFSDVTALSPKSGERLRVPFFRIETVLHAQQLLGNPVKIPLGPLTGVRLEVVDKEGQSLAREHEFGISAPGMSMEVIGPKNSPLYALLPPGTYYAYLSNVRHVRIEFTIREHDEGVQKVTLRDEGSLDE